ncbi:MAG TPA: hypothetical protein VKX49_12850 [Bryobacteraceae bacterium]|nr:hypothetical protein [Bryobacteraceae bacterium]
MKNSQPVPASKLSLQSLVDELGDKMTAVALFKAETQNRCDELKSELLLRYDEASAETSYVVKGERHVIELSAKRNERQVLDMWKLYRAVKMKLKEFLSYCKVSMTFVDSRLDPDQQEGVVYQERSGPRSVKLIQ